MVIEWLIPETQKGGKNMEKRNSKGFMKEVVDNLKKKGVNWDPGVLQGPSGPRSIVDGKEVIVLCSNNYLNFSNHPKIKQAAKKAVDTHGAGSGSVRAIAGNMDIHIAVEKKLAKFKRIEDALVYQTGFAANAGLIPQLVEKGDVIISDELNHGSIIDGVRLTKADKMIYPHQDMAGLEKCLSDADKEYKKILVITDGVFSMDGDIAKADEIVDLAEDGGAMTYNDDAHGEGVSGPDGRGSGAHYGIEGKIDVEMGTFSKAYGVVGGLIAGSHELREFALNKSRTWLLSGSHPPAVAGAQLAAIEVLEKEPEHVKKLWENTNYFKKELICLGFNCGQSETPITPVIIGESLEAKEFSKRLFEEGIFALPIVFPMVSETTARIRTMMNAGHSKDDLDEALRAFEKIGKELKVI